MPDAEEPTAATRETAETTEKIGEHIDEDIGEDGLVNRLIVVFLVLLTGLFIVTAVMVARQGLHAYQLRSRGVATTGVITEASSRGLRRGVASTYEITIDGETYTGRGGKSDDRGDELVVRFLPDAPSVHRPEATLTEDMAFGVGAVLLLGLVAYGAYGIYEVWKQSRSNASAEVVASTAAAGPPLSRAGSKTNGPPDS